MHSRQKILLALAVAATASGPTLAGPNNGTVVNGNATINGQGTSSVVINQSSQNAIINWQTFNIGNGERVQILMPNATSAELDRVTGNLGPSQIDGSLTSNGRVFLVNPNGILFGQGAEINVGSLLATTNNISNADFMAGRYNFTIPGNPSASIVNQGTITAKSGGFAALVAPGVRNTGTITAWLGRVGLASANTFALDLYGDRLIQLNVDDSIASQVIDVSTGQPLKSLVSNEGKLKANGGTVQLTAVAARQVVDSVINNTGVIEANSIGTHNGMIVLSAATADQKPTGAPTQTVTVSGKLSAAGQRSGTTGGTVLITGENIALNGATIDASGNADGGTVLIGGNGSSGNGTSAANASSANGSNANATSSLWGSGPAGSSPWNSVSASSGNPNASFGAGVTVNPASSQTTNQVANQSASLARQTLSNASTVTIDAATVINASAIVSGNGGKVTVWSDLATAFYGTILAQGGTQSGNGGSVETSGGTLTFTGTVNTSAPNGKTGTWLLDPVDLTIDTAGAAAISSGLANNNVLVFTDGSNASTAYGTTAPGSGDITINAPISWSSGNTLTIDAYNAIAINASITASNGGLTLNANSTISATAAIAIGTFNLQSGNWSQVSSTLPSFSATNFMISGGSFLRATGGNGSSGSPYQIADVYGLQGIGGSTTLLASNYILANSIDASGTANWNGGSGFVPIGNSTTNFTGTFNGNGNTISNLTINLPSAGYGGLFGWVGSGGVVENIGLLADSVSGGNAPGGPFAVGGLVGVNGGTVTNAYATGTVNGFASSVPGESFVAGGLIGINESIVSNSYSSGTVTGLNGVGGLIGTTGNGSIVTNTYSTATVTATAIGATEIGGLIGHNGAGSVTQSYAAGAVTVGSDSLQVAGLIGRNDGQVTESYATGAVTAGTNATNLGGLIGSNNGNVAQTYATGAISVGSGSNGIGSLVGFNSDSGTVTSSFWDTTTSPLFGGAGFSIGSFSATGLTTAQFGNAANFTAAGWNFGTTPDGSGWVIVDTDGSLNNANGAAGATRPMLLSEWSTTITNSHQLQLMALAPNANYTLANNINLGPSLSNPSDVWGPNGSAGFVPIGGSGILVGQCIELTACYFSTTPWSTVLTAAELSSLGSVTILNADQTSQYVIRLGETTIVFSTPSGPVTEQLPEFNGGYYIDPCNACNNASVGTFSIPTNATSATISGTFGNSVVSSSAGVNVLLSSSSSSGAPSFNGTFNGNGFTISNLTINQSTANNVGLFGVVGSNGVVQNVGLIGGSVKGAQNVGGLIGSNSGTASNTFVDGTLVTGTTAVGGLIGSNAGAVTQGVSTATVSGTQSVGGLVGADVGSSSISESRSAATVTGNSAVGGLVGYAGPNSGPVGGITISQSYATAAVSGVSDVGGLIGDIESNVTVTQTYASGPVNGTTNVGAFAGINNGGTIAQSYWDTTTSGQPIGVGSGSASGLSGLTTAQFGNAANFAGWNFGTTAGGASCSSGGACWVIVDNDGSFNNAGDAAGATRPILLSEYSTTIVFPHQLQLMGLAPSANYTLATSISPPVTSAANIWGPNGSAGFVPIGTATNPFTGTFNGNGNTISGLIINEANGSSSNPVGLFGTVGVGGVVENVGLVGGSVTGGDNFTVGALIGANYGTINNVYANSTITVGNFGIAGGLIGMNYGTVSGTSWTTAPTSCTASFTCAMGNVSVGSQGLGGGFVGINQGIITNAFAIGSVSGAAGAPSTSDVFNNVTQLGGFVGDNQGMISNAFARGTVGSAGTPYLSVAGFAGNNEGIISNAFASGVVLAGDLSTAGGFVGSNAPNNSEPCIGTGCGFNNDATITNAQAFGIVTVGASSVAGGFASNSCGNSCDGGGSFVNVSASGAVTAGHDSMVGGLIGVVGLNSTLSDSSAQNTFVASTGPNSVIGGIVGVNFGTVSNTTSSASVSGAGDSYIGGAAGINLGALNNVTVDPAISGTGSDNFIGGIAGLNVGSINSSTALVAITGGPSSEVGGIAGVNGSYSNVSATIPGSSFPNGTITNSSASGSGFSGNVGTQVPSFTPTLPAWLSNCTDGICTVLLNGSLQPNNNPNPNPPPPPNSPPPTQQTAQWTLTLFNPNTTPPPVITLVEINNVTNGGNGNPGNGGNNGNGGNGGNNGSLSSGKHGGNGAPPGMRLIDMPHMPLPPGSGLPPLNETRFLSNQLVLQFDTNNLTPQQISALAARFGLTVVAQQTIGMLGRTVYTFSISNGQSVRDLIRLIEASGLKVAVQPQYVYRFTQDGNAADQGETGDPAQYIVQKLQLAAAHRISKGENVVIAVIDSAVDAEQPDFAGGVIDRYDAGCGSTAPDAHGTGMAGAIASHVQLVGVAPSAKIIAICAFGGAGGSPEATSVKIIRGLDYAVQHGAKIVNMSFAGPYDPALAQALQVAREKGVLIVAAAGNAGAKSPPLYPGADPNVLAITATDENDHLFPGANQGKYVALAAPGVNILVPAPNGGVQMTTGTSVATANISGVAALLLAVKRSRTPEEIRAILVETAKHLGTNGINPQFGAGLVDPIRALQQVPPVAGKSAAAAPVARVQ